MFITLMFKRPFEQTHKERFLRGGFVQEIVDVINLRSNLRRHISAGIDRLPFVDRFSRNPGAVWVKMGKRYKTNSHPPL